MSEQQQLKWRKGDPRDVKESSACAHLETAFMFEGTVRMQPVAKDQIVKPHETGMEQVEEGHPIQPYGLICKSPALLMYGNAGIRVRFPKGVGSVEAIRLDGWAACQICPFWEKMAEPAPAPPEENPGPLVQ